MIRKGWYKYHHYVGMAPELFNLQNDPEETVDLAGDDSNKEIVDEMEQALRSFLDPEAVDAKAKAAQAELVEKYGGREEAISIGPASASPVPGKSDK